MESRTVDLIVVGLGAMGSATADDAARRGLSVLGVEAREQGHTAGSSHGPTRILRRVAEEGPAYVPLILDALPRWRALDEELDDPVYVENGAVRVAPVGSPLLTAFDACAGALDLDHEVLDSAALAQRFPGLAVPDGYEGRFEREAGVLFAARAVRALQDRATRHGADLHFDEPVLGWHSEGDGVVVDTGRARYRAARLVITAGAWTNALANGLALPLQVQRVVNVTFEPLDRSLVTADRLPAFIVSDGINGIYGVPAIAGHGLKVGGSGSPTDPNAVDRTVSQVDIDRYRHFVDRFFPAAAGSVTEVVTCLYTVAADDHFIIDHHPRHANVVIASPCSGHGFKYTTAIGPILTELATTGTSSVPIDAFAIDRPGLATGRAIAAS